MTKNKSKIIWVDAVSYYNLSEMPNSLIQQETEGEIVEENKIFIIVKDPITKDFDANTHRGIDNKKDIPKFLFIPKGMIKTISK